MLPIFLQIRDTCPKMGAQENQGQRNWRPFRTVCTVTKVSYTFRIGKEVRRKGGEEDSKQVGMVLKVSIND